MDRNVTVRFYEIRNERPDGPSMEDALRGIAMRPKLDREVEIEGGIILRLEHLAERGGLQVGDITRVQTRNLPGHVVDDDVNRLPVDRIGHSCAFLYDPMNKCMAVQFDMRTGIKRVCQYIRNSVGNSSFGYLPYLKDDTLDRFRHQSPKWLRLKVARVQNFARLGDGKTDFEEQIENWSHLFDAPSIEIILSTRGRDDSLDHPRVWNTIRRWLGFREMIEGIKNIEARTIEADEGFDFISDLLFESTTLDLPDNDPLQSRGIREAYVEDCYRIHRQYIDRVSGL